MNMKFLRHRALALLVGVTVLAFSGWASADPPSRVARLGYLSGTVSFSPAGEDDWVQATTNRPLTTGDRLWAEPGARTEIQIGGAMVRMSGGTSVAILNLDDQVTQLQLTQGALHVRVRHLESNQLFEVDTPNVAFTLRQPGEYRIEGLADAARQSKLAAGRSLLEHYALPFRPRPRGEVFASAHLQAQERQARNLGRVLPERRNAGPSGRA